MSNDLTSFGDGFEQFAAQGTQIIIGERLRFNKGAWLVGKSDGERLPEGTWLEARGIAAAWIKFLDGKVVDQHAGVPLCHRDMLDDNDPAAWPTGYDGKPADPWVHQNYLYLIDRKTGAEYTFVTSSWGGRSACNQVARQIAVKRSSAGPLVWPLVQLGTAYKKSTNYGLVPAPKFTVIDWVGEDGTELPPLSVPLRPQPAHRALAAELNDDIPY